MDGGLQGLYEQISTGSCGHIYTELEDCFEGCRKSNFQGSTADFETKCPLIPPVEKFIKCMDKHPQEYGHLVLPGTPKEEVVSGVSAMFAVLYGHCRTSEYGSWLPLR
ncbi:hypothetical protein CYMTET_43709 [Cymbomonas tetramitiformis]|uniref:Uncharacterized protein n=1 Tax=Cymbomonas tetramitiformis TaxID=36881 RepID=A0AAE0C3B6_9CHLO|nr:hypothetical protein CYMTET_43709 [Cymbomonas tetramitiformis]